MLSEQGCDLLDVLAAFQPTDVGDGDGFEELPHNGWTVVYDRPRVGDGPGRYVVIAAPHTEESRRLGDDWPGDPRGPLAGERSPGGPCGCGRRKRCAVRGCRCSGAISRQSQSPASRHACRLVCATTQTSRRRRARRIPASCGTTCTQWSGSLTPAEISFWRGGGSASPGDPVAVRGEFRWPPRGRLPLAALFKRERERASERDSRRRWLQNMQEAGTM